MRREPLVIAVVAAAMYLSGCCCCELPLGAQRNFDRFQCRSKQSEAKSNLKSLYVAQASYHAEHERFGTLAEVGFAPAGETIRYEYVLISHDEDAFVAEARGLDEMTGDVWQVDDTGEVRSLRSICGPLRESADPSGGGPVEVMLPDPTDKLELKRAAFQVRY